MSKFFRLAVHLGFPLAAGLSGHAVHAAALQVSNLVDTAVCATGAVQCNGGGHTFAAASSTNHNPIALRVTVVGKSGLPDSSFALTDFTFVNGLVPAGGGAAGVCSTAVCGTAAFGNLGNGLYQIYLDRIPTGNWKAGGYAGVLQVGSGTNHGTALVTFTIPN